MECLHDFSNFEVVRAREICDKVATNLHITVPDHSLIQWKVNMKVKIIYKESTKVNANTSREKVVYNVADIPDSFMKDEDTLQKIHDFIDKIELQESSQQSIDSMFKDFCGVVKDEMDKKLDCRKINSPKCCKFRHKPWWNKQLAELWKSARNAERDWVKSKGPPKRRLKEHFKERKRILDREIQRTKRTYWHKEQLELLNSLQNNHKFFWKNIGKVGIGSNRQKSVPMEFMGRDGEVIYDKETVMEKWRAHFENLLNNGVQLNEPETLLFHNNLPQAPNIESLEPLNTPITQQDVFAAVHRAKRNKACGLDGIPVEVLANLTVQIFMTNFFNICFQTGTVPQSWNTGILHPIIKDTQQDNRDPNNYRGLMISSHMSIV